MAAAQTGDGAAYRRLLAEVYGWLTRYFSRRLPASFVDDAAQETLIAIHKKKHTYDPQRPFGFWLAAIARFKWIDALRTLQSPVPMSVADESPMVDSVATIAHAEVLDRLLGMLKSAQAEVIRLVKIQGLTIDEASIRTGRSRSWVKVNIHRGLARLGAIAQLEVHEDP